VANSVLWRRVVSERGDSGYDEMPGKTKKAWFRFSRHQVASSLLKWPVPRYRPALPEGIHAAIVPPLSGQVNWGVAKW
jgi:hypothetical protein